MLENLFWLAVGLVAGVVYHAWLSPYVKSGLAWLGRLAKKAGIGVRRDNG